MIGRERERRRLLDAAQEDESRFVAVYGRRRVGKTYLVRETFSKQFAFVHTGSASGTMCDQLASFCNSLRAYGLKDCRDVRSWIDAFEELKRLIEIRRDRKKIVFIDELPWMDTPKSRFLPAFENFWNGWASARKDVLLIVCGSATSWLLDKVIRSRGGLHNRVTHRVHLKPFTLRECEAYAASRHLKLNRAQIAEYYMAFGGVAYYWSVIEKGESAAQAINRLYFSSDGELRSEFNELYRSLFRHPEPYMRIVETLGRRKSGLSRAEIAQRAAPDDSGHLTGYLDELEECGFVRKYVCYGKSRRDALYQLIDNFTLFHFSFCERQRTKGRNYWLTSLDAPEHVVWSGLAFERLCLEHVDEIKTALGVGGVQAETFAWRGETPTGKGVQIDLIIDRRDGVVNLCEMKYSTKPYVVTKREAEALTDRQWALKEKVGVRKTLHVTLVSPAGIVDNAQAADIQKVIVLDDLFREVLVP